MSIVPAFVRRRIAHRPNLLKIVDNIGWLFVDKVLRMGVGLLVGVWIARYLGPEQFGLFSFATAFIGLFGAIAGLGLQGIVVRDIVRDPETARLTLGTAAVLQLAGGLVAYLLTLAAIAYLRADDVLARTIVAILGATMLLKASELAAYWFESQVQSKYTVWVQNSAFLAFAAVKVSLILSHASLVLFAWAVLVEAAVVALALIVVMGKRGPKLSSLNPRADRAIKLLKDSWPLFLSAIAVVLYMRIDQIMLGQMTGDAEVGIYSAAVRISEIWFFIPTAITASVFPAIMVAKSANEKQYFGLLQSLYDYLVMLAIAIAIAISIAADDIVSMLYGAGYERAGDILNIHIWTGVFVAMGVARRNWLLAENMQHMALLYLGLGALVNVVGNMFAIPSSGGTGAAWTTLAAQITSSLLAPMVFTKTRISATMFLRSLSPFQWGRRVLQIASVIYRKA